MGEKLKMAVIVFGFGVLWGGYEFYDFYSTNQTVMEQQERATKEKLDIARNEMIKLRKFAEGIVEIKARLKKTNAEFEEALEFIPRTLDLSKLLARLNVLARNSGIEIESFKPNKEVAQDSNNAADNNAFFQSMTMELRLRGGFSQTVMFFDQVSRLKRILNVESLKMTPEAKDEKKGGVSPVTMVATSVILKTYRFSQ